MAGDTQRVGPTFAQRQLSSTIYLEDGDVAVVGFATVPRAIQTTVGVPLLHSLPFLGFLFRSTEERWLDTTLLVSVQATIVREETLSLTRALRRRLVAAESMSPGGGVTAEH